MTDPGGLRRSLPQDLADRVDAAVDEWRATDKVARVWARDASVWTGKDEDTWLGWLDVTHDRAADAFEDLVRAVHHADFTDAVVLGMGGSSLCPRCWRPRSRPGSAFPGSTCSTRPTPSR